jgi:hypothetical protein
MRGASIRRREFITVLGGAATWSLAANAEQVRRIGVLSGFAESDRDAQSGLALFREELRKLGWTEGRNIEMEIHAAGGDVESIKRFAKELVARPHGARQRIGARRRGDRIETSFAAVHESAFGT